MRSFPWSCGSKALAQTRIRSRRRIQPFYKRGISLLVQWKDGSVQHGSLSRLPRGIEHEIRPVLARELRCLIDQVAESRLDPQIQRLALETNSRPNSR